MKRYGISLLSVISLCLFAVSQAGAVHLEWVQTYDSPDHSDDYGFGVAVDTTGNIFVTGFEYRGDLGQSSNVWLRKYDTNGNTLWTETYDNPGHSSDVARGVALDAAGNVYVTGIERRDDLGQNLNIWLGKYDTDGNILWTETYDSPDHGYDSGEDIAVDAAGNVYVTGCERRDDLGQSQNIWLGKYDTDGNILWTRTYDSPDHGRDWGHGVALDTAGNVYVTGYEVRDDLGQDENIWLRKYDTDGNTLWTETYDNPEHNPDFSRNVAVDSAGNAYVIGRECRYDLGQQDNIWLRKYDTDGNTLWTQTYDNPAHLPDIGYGVAVDSAGDVYVTGTVNRDDLSQGINIWLRKYDTDGNTLWTETYDSPAHSLDWGFGVAVDALGNTFVTGHERRADLGQSNNIILLKYSQIPEPSTLLLLAPALLGIAGVVLKRRK